MLNATTQLPLATLDRANRAFESRLNDRAMSGDDAADFAIMAQYVDLTFARAIESLPVPTIDELIRLAYGR